MNKLILITLAKKTLAKKTLATIILATAVPLITFAEEEAQGPVLFAKHCSGCHGAAGEGSDPWYPALRETAGEKTLSALAEVILTGQFRRGGEINGHTIPTMPSWYAFSDAEVAHLVNYINDRWGQSTLEVLSAEDVATIRRDF